VSHNFPRVPNPDFTSRVVSSREVSPHTHVHIHSKSITVLESCRDLGRIIHRGARKAKFSIPRWRILLLGLGDPCRLRVLPQWVGELIPICDLNLRSNHLISPRRIFVPPFIIPHLGTRIPAVHTLMPTLVLSSHTLLPWSITRREGTRGSTPQ